MPGFHLVTDLDGTWLPGPGQVPHLRRLESSLAACPGAVLTFATGRTFRSALEAIARWELRPPHHLISDVGTALFHRTDDGGWAEDEAWAARVAAAWDAEAAGRMMAAGLPAGLQLQPDLVPIRRLALQRAEGADMEAAEAALRQACRAHGLTVDILPSHGFYFDVLPRGVHKGSALAFLQASQGLPRPIVGCGDSANDLGLFEAADLPLVMMGGLEDAELPPSLIQRTHRTSRPGPQGIHQALVAFGWLKEDRDAH